MWYIIWVFFPIKNQDSIWCCRRRQLEIAGLLLLKFHIKQKTTYIFASTYPTILPFSSSAMYESCVVGDKQETVLSVSTKSMYGRITTVCPRYADDATHLRPGQPVVKVVFHLIVFGKAQQVTMLHVHEVLRLKGSIHKVRLMHRLTLSDNTLKGT